MKFESLKGKTLVNVAGKAGDESMVFTCDDGTAFELYHEQDCCESVLIEDICGDLSDLVGEVLLAEEASNSEEDDDRRSTWTFYRIGTARGHVTIRWLGTSNGYYSESVSFRELVS